MCDVAVHDRGRAVAVAVVHGRAWPSCVWPWCRVRLCVVVMSWRPGCVCGVSCLWWCRGRAVAVAVPWRGRRALGVVASLDMAVVTWP